jgi:hypothetical protein
MNPNDAQERLSAMLAPLPIDDALFPATSRYHGLRTVVWNADSDRPVVYLRRRLVPHPERLATIGFHVVADRDRPDTIAAVQLGDPELFWRLCDANRAVFADELVAEIGRRLRVAAPEGTPGAETGGTGV